MLHSKKIVRIIVDLLSINLSFLITCLLSVQFPDFFALGMDTHLKVLWVIVNLMWFATLSTSNKLYGRFEYTRFRVELKTVLKNVIIHITGLIFISLFISHVSIIFFATFYSALLLFIFTGRFILHLLLPRVRSISTLNYIIIGYSDALTGVEKTIIDAHLGKVKYLGSFGEKIPNHYKRIGGVSKLYDFLNTQEVNLILYASNELQTDEARQLMNYAKLNFIDIKIIPLELGIISSGVKLEVHGGFPILSVHDENIARIRNRFIKRTFDILFSLGVLIFIFPWLYVILAFLIKRESNGPVFFTQNRVGLKNRQFKCYKFRSMKANTEREDEKFRQAVKGDSRITKIGAFMRRTNLDEFPQFINVLKGDMSIVGPRPHPIKLDLDLKKEIEEYILRHYTKPGITGWAQVNGFRGPTATKEQKEGRVNHDIWYLRNWSFGLDLKIIFLTILGTKVKENAF